MALHLQTFRTRALTAFVFALVMLAGLLWNGWSFVTLFALVHVGCWYEFVKLIKKIYPHTYGYYLPLGIVYITLPVLMMLFLGMMNISINILTDYSTPGYSYIIPCGIIFSIWINDTMAYLVGSFIGKTPFSRISPKKTWEGTAGGAILCIIVISLIGWLLKYLTLVDWICISAICAVFGTLGDLLESKLKRLAGVKDSGSILPGHGGFLDRFDSFLLATPVVWLYVMLTLR